MRTHNPYASGIAVAMFSYIMSAPVLSADVLIRKVADSGTELPGGDTVQFIHSGQLDGARTVFEADTSAPLSGLWAEEAGEIQAVVATDTAIPGRAENFVAFGEYSHEEDVTVFYGEYPEACDFGACGGIYENGPGGLSLVADTDQLMPGRSTEFEILDSPVVTGEGLAFRGGTSTGVFSLGFGVFADLGNGLVTVADWETPTPLGSGTLSFDFFGSRLDVHEGEVFFYATNTDDFETGYYAWEAATGDYRVLRNADTPVPGTQGTFDSAEGDTFRDGTYAFYGTNAGNPDERLYADFGDGLAEIVSASELAAEWFGGAVEFLTVAAGAGTVAFTAGGDGQFGENRLFVYSAKDRAVISILGAGDIVDGRYVNRVEINRNSLDGESIAIIVEFQETFERELHVASLHTPAHQMVDAPDVDGNGYGELVLLRQDATDRSYEIQVRDAFTGGISATFPLGEDPVYDIAMMPGSGEPPQLAVYSKNAGGRLLVKLYSLEDGALIRTIQLWKDMRPIAMTILADLNGNGAPEVAAMAESSKPFVRLQIIDTDTEELLNALVHGSSLRPVALLSVPDIGAGPASEVVIMGVVRSTAKVRFIVQDAGDGTILSDFFAGFDDKAPVYHTEVLDDVTGDGVPDLALARRRIAQGKAGYELRDILTGASPGESMPPTDARPLWMTALDDMTGDGRPELGVLLVAPDGASRVEVNDVAGNVLLDSIDMLAIENAKTSTTTPDIDASGREEIVTLGRHFTLDMLEIHDAGDGDPLRYYFVP